MMNTADLDYSHYYRVWHDSSEEHAIAMSEHVLDEFAQYLPVDKKSNALDIGCGMGFLMLGLIREGYTSVSGVDIDKSQIDACKARNLVAERISSLTDYLNKHEQEFDLITMIDVLEHIPVESQISTLIAIRKCLRPKGRLIIQVPNANSIIASRWKYQDFTHTSTFTENSIRFALLNSSFKDICIPPTGNNIARPSLRPLGFFQPRRMMYLRRWLVRWIWKQVLIAELGTLEISDIPLNPNLIAIADV